MTTETQQLSQTEEKQYSQAEVDALLATRDGEVESIRSSAREALRQATGRASDVDSFLSEQATKEAHTSARLPLVGKFFGKNAVPGEANALARKDINLYRQLRGEAENLGLISRIAPPLKTGSKVFIPLKK